MLNSKFLKRTACVAMAVVMSVCFMPSMSFDSYAAKGKVKKIVRLKPTKSSATFNLEKGERIAFKVYSTPRKLKKSEYKVKFTSSNPKVVKISSRGSALAVKEGRVKITCKNLKSGARVAWNVKVVKHSSSLGKVIKAKSANSMVRALKAYKGMDFVGTMNKNTYFANKDLFRQIKPSKASTEFEMAQELVENLNVKATVVEDPANMSDKDMEIFVSRLGLMGIKDSISKDENVRKFYAEKFTTPAKTEGYAQARVNTVNKDVEHSEYIAYLSADQNFDDMKNTFGWMCYFRQVFVKGEEAGDTMYTSPTSTAIINATTELLKDPESDLSKAVKALDGSREKNDAVYEALANMQI